MEFGYKLSSEEHDPPNLLRHAARAEEVGFQFAMISDHYHPWTDQQGQSPLIWSVLGGVAQVTRQLKVGTAVHVSDVPLPSDDHCPGCSHGCLHDARTVHARRGLRRELERAHHR